LNIILCFSFSADNNTLAWSPEKQSQHDGKKFLPVYIKYCDTFDWIPELLTLIRKELGKGISAVTDIKLVAEKYYCGNESVITFQQGNR
jgi:hypothetical protein